MKRDLHVKAAGVVVLKKAFVIDRDIGDVEEPTPEPRRDTDGCWLGSDHYDLLSTSDMVRRHDDCPKDETNTRYARAG